MLRRRRLRDNPYRSDARSGGTADHAEALLRVQIRSLRPLIGENRAFASPEPASAPQPVSPPRRQDSAGDCRRTIEPHCRVKTSTSGGPPCRRRYLSRDSQSLLRSDPPSFAADRRSRQSSGSSIAGNSPVWKVVPRVAPSSDRTKRHKKTRRPASPGRRDRFSPETCRAYDWQNS